MSEAVSRVIGGPLSWLLGIKKDAVGAVLLSLVGGFPNGAICIRHLFDNGTLTKEEAERILTFTSTASPTFCIGVVGLSLFGNTSFGVKLYIYQITAALLTAVITRKGNIKTTKSQAHSKKHNMSDVLTSSISDSGMTMLKVCAFTVFFAVIGDAACIVCETYLGNIPSAICASFCELTLACRRCAALNEHMAKLLCSFAVGYSGLSVHMQTASVLSGSGVKLSGYHTAKMLQGIFCAIMTLVIP